jgi:DNA polymerase-1
VAEWAYTTTNGSKPDQGSLIEAPVLSFDVESNGKDIGSSVPLGWSLANCSTSGYYAPSEDQFSKNLLAMDKLVIAHNAPFDRSMAKKAGVVIDNMACTMVAAHLLEKPSLALKNLTPLHVKSFAELEHGFANMSITDIGKYSCPHAMAAFGLWTDYEQKMKDLALTKLFWGIEMPLVPVLSDMELNGVMVDKKALGELGEIIDGMLGTLREALNYWSGTSGVNFNSPDQLADVLYKKLGLPPHRWMKTVTGRPTTEAKYLESIKHLHSFVPTYLNYKHLMTLRNSYVRSLSKIIHDDGRVYGKFNQTGTRTGRLSSSEPNLQKIPVRTELGRRIRMAFVAPEGFKLLVADYDQLELKLLAICSKNKYLLDAFRSNRDIHLETALRAFRDAKRRPEAKTSNFQVVYGGGSIAQREPFFIAYPGVREWIASIHREARAAQYIRTLGGRIRTIAGYVRENRMSVMSDPEEAHGDRETLSTLIQGSSAESVKVGMVEFWKPTRDTEVKMDIQVHDEVLTEVPEKLVMDVARLMKEKMTIRDYEIPLTVSLKVGDNWGNMTKLELN